MSINRWMGKENEMYIHMELYVPVKTFAEKWVQLEIILLNKISQDKKKNKPNTRCFLSGVELKFKIIHVYKFGIH